MGNEIKTDAGGSPVERPVRPDPMRDAFEAWYNNDGQWPAAVERSSYGPGYKLGAADHAWNAWQACWPLARAAIYSAEQAQIEAPLRAEIERLRADLKAMEGFADLWYFVSDEAPLAFEKIVADYSPGRWLTEAHKLRAAKRGA